MQKNISEISTDDQFFVFLPIGHDKQENIVFDKSKIIAAKFFVFGGKMVADALDDRLNPVNLYSSITDNGRINEAARFQNIDNYLVVPVAYDPTNASAFAKTVNAGIASRGLAAGTAI